jgi:hypothetical protein
MTLEEKSHQSGVNSLELLEALKQSEAELEAVTNALKKQQEDCLIHCAELDELRILKERLAYEI